MRWPALAGVAATAAVAVAAPIVVLADWALDGLNRQAAGGRRLTIDSDAVLDATWNTLRASTITAAVAVFAVLPIAFLVARYRSRLGNLTHAVVISTFALPGILIALALRFWTIRAGLAGDLLFETLALLVFAYVVSVRARWRWARLSRR